MRIACGHVFKYAVPGQFVMIRNPDQLTPLLSRPFSIHDIIIEESRVRAFDILYKIVGAGTLKLSQASPGDQIDVLGPLGRGFSTRGEYKQVYFVAGGSTHLQQDNWCLTRFCRCIPVFLTRNHPYRDLTPARRLKWRPGSDPRGIYPGLPASSEGSCE